MTENHFDYINYLKAENAQLLADIEKLRERNREAAARMLRLEMDLKRAREKLVSERVVKQMHAAVLRTGGGELLPIGHSNIARRT